jgi:hypothetical protein
MVLVLVVSFFSRLLSLFHPTFDTKGLALLACALCVWRTPEMTGHGIAWFREAAAASGAQLLGVLLSYIHT